MIFSDLFKKRPGTSKIKEVPQGSRRKFKKVNKRSGTSNVIKHDEAASSDKKSTEHFIGDFKMLAECEECLLQQNFNYEGQKQPAPSMKQSEKSRQLTNSQQGVGYQARASPHFYLKIWQEFIINWDDTHLDCKGIFQTIPIEPMVN
ncbi:hypothetical protein TNCT_691721 [Trichonephila clavata]|uniref:Uncharacterized protein n=1 Tax=Trichonephila clavata TaxID=2740835 RepID=A0A8X6JRB1_TRICU|nr:hypothetical protein TNCT_691721 [Trichonephila clavata]